MRAKRDNTYMYVGIIVLLILIVLYIVSDMAGWGSTTYTCIEFMVGAFALMLVIPHIAPIKYTKYDEQTPETSRVFGTVINNTGTIYFFIEIVVAAIFIHTGNGTPAFVMYVQAALMIVYLSLVAFLVARPASEPQEDARGRTPTTRSSGAGNVTSTDRRDRMIAEVKRDRSKTSDTDILALMDQLDEALTKSPATSYKSMDDTDYQLAALIGELGARLDEHNKDMAVECLQLSLLLVEQRNALYQKTNKRARGKGKR